jgi:hypothetical protein
MRCRDLPLIALSQANLCLLALYWAKLYLPAIYQSLQVE